MMLEKIINLSKYVVVNDYYITLLLINPRESRIFADYANSLGDKDDHMLSIFRFGLSVK